MISYIKKIPFIPKIIRSIYYIYLNKLILKINNIQFGCNLKIYNHIYIYKHPKSIITIGDNFVFTSGDALNPLCRNIRGSIYAPLGGIIHIGNNVGISSACIWAKEKITIGNHVNIGGDSIIMDTDAHSLDYMIRATKTLNQEGISTDTLSAKSKPITIEDHVFIGTRCIILKGVTIGARSIIGSGSVVTKSIPPDCIAAGNPCKIIKYINEK